VAELSDKRGLLIVSLPRNEVDLAKAAADAGAEWLKVHVNAVHRASGTRFGSLAEERQRLEAILSVGPPVGLVPGEDEMITPDEVGAVRAMGFAFLDAYLHRLPLYLFDAGIPVIPACTAETPTAVLGGLADLPGEWLEAAVVHPSGYGRPPVAEDLALLAAVGEASGRRLIVPTQRAIRPEDLPRYFEIPSVDAIMIGAIVTGTDPASVGRATAAFRAELDRIFGPGRS
jgi:hypothetical protein